MYSYHVNINLIRMWHVDMYNIKIEREEIKDVTFFAFRPILFSKFHSHA